MAPDARSPRTIHGFLKYPWTNPLQQWKIPHKLSPDHSCPPRGVPVLGWELERCGVGGFLQLKIKITETKTVQAPSIGNTIALIGNQQ